MKRLLQEIPIKSIVIDKKLYPRSNYSWQTVHRYSESMRLNSIFPPITVALFRNKHYLIDGRHRIEATKGVKKKSIMANVIKDLSLKDIFVKAIELNITNGLPLSPYDKALCVQKLKSLNYSDEKISYIVQIPIQKLDSFMAERIVNDLTGEEIVLKAPYRSLAGKTIDRESIGTQDKAHSMSVVFVVDELLQLFESRAIDRNNKKLAEKLKILHKYIEKFITKNKL